MCHANAIIYICQESAAAPTRQAYPLLVASNVPLLLRTALGPVAMAVKNSNGTRVKEHKKRDDNKTVRVVFISLLLDLLAFTMILPLFPALLDHYEQIDNGKGLYSMILQKVHTFGSLVDAPSNVNSVLFGGFLGSLYSFLQFLGSPIVGALSDVYGRKPLMILCLTGISMSYLLWAFSSNFGLFILARVLGGISKGNVSLSMAIISDVTLPATRGKSMALVGVAFSVGFVLGPMIGATFARLSIGSREGHWYAFPAMFAFFLSLCDWFYVVVNMKESLPVHQRAKSLLHGISGALTYINPKDAFQFNSATGLSVLELSKLRKLGRIYFFYLFIYSGLEFTLTFLTHYAFGFTRMQQGWMFLGIGVTMAVLQGSWVRRIPEHKTKEMTELGLWLVIPSFICIGLAENVIVLCTGIFLYAVLTSIGPENQKGVITGIFRSLGALARACGPIVTSIAFWSLGSSTTYLIGAAALVIPPLILRSIT
ncbi:major facilitator superfamily domain-containing protein 10 isoform X2 [Copidosoma floridanum]|uniref:major facilitator superfamily domain-containing protein 10 isoform X2 n=1 Tax=Copidosoma floridanum TaxID=29053 RepID=UPI000C6F640A|nr:major facilitator superfamily domain-containing protein 10 isoform X2 [Copidosoma floridanum]